MVLGEVSMASHAVSEMVRFGSVYSVLCQYVALVVSPSPARTILVSAHSFECDHDIAHCILKDRDGSEI